MKTKVKSSNSKRTKEAMVKIPLSALHKITGFPKKNRVIFEIDTASLKRVNEPSTLDEIVAEARLEKALGKTKSFTFAGVEIVKRYKELGGKKTCLSSDSHSISDLEKSMIKRENVLKIMSVDVT